jgi:hypothetical protein
MSRDDAEIVCRAIIPIMCEHILKEIARSMRPLLERIATLEACVSATHCDRPPQLH